MEHEAQKLEAMSVDDLAWFRGAQQQLIAAQGAVEYVSKTLSVKYQLRQGDTVNFDTGVITRGAGPVPIAQTRQRKARAG